MDDEGYVMVFRIKLHQNVINGLWYTWKSSFLILYKESFVTDECVGEWEVPNGF
jgi:hypothetical protein